MTWASRKAMADFRTLKDRYPLKIEGVVFDLDGTLLDTHEDLAGAVNQVLQKQGFPTHPIEAYRYFIGDGPTLLIRRALPAGERTETKIAECIASFKEAYLENWNRTTKPFDGVVEVISKLVEVSVKLAVLSNKPDNFTKICVDHFFEGSLFQAVLGTGDRTPPKPDPTGAKWVAERLQLEPQHILYIGDSGVDMKTALNAGMLPVGVLWGFRSREELITCGAKLVISKPDEILSLVRVQI